MAAAPPPYDGGGRGGRGDFGGRGGRGFGRGGGGPPVDATASIQVPQLYYSIDVECVATAPDHNARAVAQIALVDQYERVMGGAVVVWWRCVFLGALLVVVVECVCSDLTLP
jgi:hypothetical protein